MDEELKTCSFLDTETFLDAGFRLPVGKDAGLSMVGARDARVNNQVSR
jgi:hypothetical protein